MRKLYEEPEAEMIEIDAFVSTLNDSGDLEDFNNGDGGDIDDLLDD